MISEQEFTAFLHDLSNEFAIAHGRLELGLAKMKKLPASEELAPLKADLDKVLSSLEKMNQLIKVERDKVRD
jgi:hypothetical protein